MHVHRLQLLALRSDGWTEWLLEVVHQNGIFLCWGEAIRSRTGARASKANLKSGCLRQRKRPARISFVVADFVDLYFV